jgi:hypothetical protein
LPGELVWTNLLGVMSQMLSGTEKQLTMIYDMYYICLKKIHVLREKTENDQQSVHEIHEAF